MVAGPFRLTIRGWPVVSGAFGGGRSVPITIRGWPVVSGVYGGGRSVPINYTGWVYCFRRSEGGIFVPPLSLFKER